MHTVFSAMKAIIKKEKSFLVVKQSLGQSTVWDLPGGKVEYGESPYETLEREIKEELGIGIKNISITGIWWFFRSKDQNQVICTTFSCFPTSYDINIKYNPAKNENIVDYKWTTKHEFLNDFYNVSNESLKKLILQIDV